MNIFEEERNLIKDVCKELIDEKWIANIIDNYIYHFVEETDKNGRLLKYQAKCGEKHGEYKSWYKYNHMCTWCYYKNDKLHGEYKEWNPNACHFTECNYINGKLDGEYKIYMDYKHYSPKKLFCIRNYKNGELLKIDVYDGDLIIEQHIYKDSKKVEYRKWNDFNKILKIEIYENEKKAKQSFYKDGKIIKETYY